MPADAAQFEVKSVFHVAGHTETLVSGQIEGGAIRAGMQAKFIFVKGLFVYAKIKSVEHATRADGTRQVELVVETSKADADAPWQDLCQASGMIIIEDMEGRPREPAVAPRVSRPFRLMKVFTWLAVGLMIASVFSPAFMDLGPNGRQTRRWVNWFFVAAIFAAIILRNVSAVVAVKRAQRAALEAARRMGVDLPPAPGQSRDPTSALDTPPATRD